jgi:hypothetical protein
MTRTTSFGPLALVAAAAVFAIACTGGSPGPSATPSATGTQPAPTPTPAATPVSGVTSAAQAAALVFASDPRWSAMTPLRADLIGASRWYEALAEADGFGVTITAGSGDCQAGCINKTMWIYHVDLGGEVTLVRQEDDDVEIDNPIGTADPAHVNVSLTAGPMCPVERNPPDPGCAPRPVANAIVTLFDPNGAEVATATSDEAGLVMFEVPAGAYYVEAQPVQGLMGTPEAQAFAVVGGDTAGLALGYATGIR